jgi:tetratricopeptide (TPR) repeat protein
MSETWERAQQARIAGNLEAAAKLYLEALQSHPFGSRQALGMINANLGRLDEAEAWFRQAIDAGPARPAARYSFAIFLLRLGRYAEAWPLYEARRQIAGFAIPSFGDLLPPAGAR